MSKFLKNLNPFNTTKRKTNAAATSKPKEKEAPVVDTPSNPHGLLNLKQLAQPQWTRFEDANPWEPEEHTVVYCMNDSDNIPTKVSLDNGTVYCISQARSPGHKDQGQDCMATASHGNWELHVLCDGHDRLGHMVALGVCQNLPKIILRKIHERNKKNPEAEDEPVTDTLVNESFDECANVVCWTKDNITVGLWVKVVDGQWADKPGFIKESNSKGNVRVAIIDENGYHLPTFDKESLRRPRYTGGCTCICLIRNKKTKECKIAVSGDSRILILPTMGVQDAVLMRQLGVEEDNVVPEGLITPAHNVHNEDEKARLEKDFSGQYEYDGNFLVNPITKFAIQPTRGFGDFDMFGTGYTHRPEITKTFKLEPNGLILAASDGVFDTHVWQDEELVSALHKFREDKQSNARIIDSLYRETLQRSLEGGYVDDISLFCFIESEEGAPTKVAEAEADPVEEKPLPSEKTVQKKRQTKENRRTIGRDPNDYSGLSAKVLQMKKIREQEAAQKAEQERAEEEKFDDLVKEDAALLSGNENLLKSLAASHKVLPPVKGILTTDDQEQKPESQEKDKDKEEDKKEKPTI